MNQDKGFTLIELLVVIAVIGILAGMIIVSTGGARFKARDAKRMSDMRALLVAQELYMSDNQRYYTCSGSAGDCNPRQATNYPNDLGNRMPTTPKDPKNTGSTCDGTSYIYCGLSNTADDQNFCYYAKLEESATAFFTAAPKGNAKKAAIPTGFTDCGTPG